MRFQAKRINIFIWLTQQEDGKEQSRESFQNNTVSLKGSVQNLPDSVTHPSSLMT